MTLKQLKRIFLSELNSIYPKTEIESFFYMLMADFYNLKRVDIALDPDKEISIDAKFHKALNDLVNQKPIQYILGKTEFYGFEFKVTKDVLIPRPETEELVNWIIQYVKTIQQTSKFKLLDIGTGSGCIAVSLAKNLQHTQVFALDISKNSLKIAEQNAKINTADVTFVEDNILQLKSNIQDSKFKIIVSNPPYVRNLEKKEINTNVLDNEPHLALFVADDNPLLFYNAITDFALKNLTKNGVLFLEINQYLAKETINLLKEKGFKNIELKKDIFKNDRMIKASLM